MKLIDIRMNDGSRQFAVLPESAEWHQLYDHIATLEGAVVLEMLTDGAADMWLDFDYGGQRFTVNSQFGEYWFFVQDPDAPDEVLEQVAAHCAQLLY